MPTRRISRDTFNFLGIEFVRLDFGGQIQYREEYLKNPKKYLSGTDLMFYVIDVQDIERYSLALDYLEAIIEIVKTESEKQDFSIFLHKYDPNIHKNEKFRKNLS